MLYEITAVQFTKMLKNLDAILAKTTSFAETKKFDVGVLLSSRLAPDQFNFTRQIQIACDTAKICVSKLTGKEAPAHEDKETTLQDLRTRISQTTAFLATVIEKDFSAAAERKVTTPRWEGKWLSGHEYVTQHSIPNFYFHVTVAYEILRHNGLEIGKKDYLGPMPFKN
jgi:uncharacterized protein